MKRVILVLLTIGLASLDRAVANSAATREANIRVAAPDSQLDVELRDLAKRGSWLMKSANNDGYVPAPQRQEFERSLADFQSTVASSKTDTEKLQALEKYKGALRKFEKSTADNRPTFFGFKYRNSATDTVNSNVRRAERIAESNNTALPSAPPSRGIVSSAEEASNSVPATPGDNNGPQANGTAKPAIQRTEDPAKRKRDETTAAVPRCLYSGFLGKNEGPTNKCSPIRSTKQARASGVKLNGVKNFDCGAGSVMCNPLVFGVTETRRPHCVKETKAASSDCMKVSNITEAKAKKRYKELLQDVMNQTSREALMARVDRACNRARMIEDAEHTENITLRKDKDDHLKTCAILQIAIKRSTEAHAPDEKSRDRRDDSQLLNDQRSRDLIEAGGTP
jgi:hypothetical protein